MANTWNKNLPNDIQFCIEEVIEQLDIDGYDVFYNEPLSKIQFRKGYHSATILVDLIKKGQWADIRHIFRASMLSGPQVTNYLADDTEWDRNWR